MAVIYLALHLLACHSAKPTSKVLWFFSVITAPLTRPIRKWLLPSASERRRLTVALVIYMLLWILFIGLERLLVEP
jgi:hypothetical protein